MIIRRIAELSGRSDLFHIGARVRTADEPAILFADTEKIRSTGWRPYITLEEGLAHSLHWWRSGRLHAA